MSEQHIAPFARVFTELESLTGPGREKVCLHGFDAGVQNSAKPVTEIFLPHYIEVFPLRFERSKGRFWASLAHILNSLYSLWLVGYACINVPMLGAIADFPASSSSQPDNFNPNMFATSSTEPPLRCSDSDRTPSAGGTASGSLCASIASASWINSSRASGESQLSIFRQDHQM
jgi:hypothetical protein